MTGRGAFPWGALLLTSRTTIPARERMRPAQTFRLVMLRPNGVEGASEASMGFEDELGQARRGNSGKPPGPDYKNALDRIAEKSFNAIGISPGKWTRAHLQAEELADRERVPGTLHMASQDPGAVAYYWVDIGDNYKITVDFHGRPATDGGLHVTAAGIVLRPDRPGHDAELANFKRALTDLAKKNAWKDPYE